MVHKKINGHIKMHALGWKHQVQLEEYRKHTIGFENNGFKQVKM
jgi:hypothetical protein